MRQRPWPKAAGAVATTDLSMVREQLAAYIKEQMEGG